MTHDRYDCNAGCPVEATLGLIGGKWKGVILYHLLNKTYRFNELRRLMPGLTQKMLTKQLRELEADGLIKRQIYREIPPKVEYSITEYGETLGPVVAALQHWGLQHLQSKATTNTQEASLKTA